MRYALMVLCLFFASATSVVSAAVQVSVGIAIPGISIGINLPSYPQLALVPGYPVYYAPYLDANYFFYDGMYWIFVENDWYVSYWYNGPWELVYSDYVPLFILRVPVYYYRRPPVYFHGWWLGAPPRWGDHWGRDWEHRHRGWHQWDLSKTPAPAPLPEYQREYRGDRYPPPDQQSQLHKKHYRYQPRDAVVQQHYQRKEVRVVQPDQQRRPRWQAEPEQRNYPHQRIQPYRWPSSQPQGVPDVPHNQSPQWRNEKRSESDGQQRFQQDMPPSKQSQGSPFGSRTVSPQGREGDVQRAIPPALMRRRAVGDLDERQIQVPQKSRELRRESQVIRGEGDKGVRSRRQIIRQSE